MGEPCRLMPESACVHRSYPALRWGCPPSPAGVATPPVLTARCGRASESRIVPLRTSYQPGASARHSFYLFQYQPACGLPELRATLVGVKRGTSGWRSRLPTAGLLSQTALGGCCPEPEADGAAARWGLPMPPVHARSVSHMLISRRGATSAVGPRVRPCPAPASHRWEQGGASSAAPWWRVLSGVGFYHTERVKLRICLRTRPGC